MGSIEKVAVFNIGRSASNTQFLVTEFENGPEKFNATGDTSEHNISAIVKSVRELQNEFGEDQHGLNVRLGRNLFSLGRAPQAAVPDKTAPERLLKLSESILKSR